MRLSTFSLTYALLSVFFTTFCFTITAQDAPIKYGKIDIADLQMKVYPKDTSAEAVVLGDVGRAYFDYSALNDGFQVVYERHRRIKILKKSGYDWATIKVPLYNNKNGSKKEDLYDLQAFTYNLENGQIIKEKLEKESVFLDKKDDNHSVKRFAFAKVKEGSIIEYSYKIRSDFYYNFHDWVFQSSIPVAWSDFTVSVPNYFVYRQLSQGYEPYFINTVFSGQIFFTIKNEAEEEKSGVNFTRNQSSFEKVSTESKDFRWVMKNVPSLREEPYMTTIDDYVSKIQLELSSTRSPKSLQKNYSNTWESLNDVLVEDELLGGQINRSTFLKEAASTIKISSKDTLVQIGMALNFVKEAMTWDNRESIYCSTSLKKALDVKTGNVAEINLLLVALLKELGYDANPVILSTRDNGRILDDYVLLSKFNYVIAQVDMGGKDLLLDATTVQLPVGVLPVRCLNGRGRLIGKNKTRWVSLQSLYKDSETVVCNLTLDKDGKGQADLTLSHVGYNNVNERMKYLKQGEEKYLQAFKQKNTTWEFKKNEFENLENITEPFIIKNELTVNDFATIAGERVYFNPIIYNVKRENPFKNPNRKFPVDFGTIIEENFIATYIIPQGYIVEEMPKSIKVSLPEDGGRFTYAVGLSEDGKITISSKISLKKTMYFAEEYVGLRAFYDQIVQKHAEQIVLKKK